MKQAKYILVSISRETWIKKNREEREKTGGEMDAEDLVYLALRGVFEDPGAVTIVGTFDEEPEI